MADLLEQAEVLQTLEAFCRQCTADELHYDDAYQSEKRNLENSWMWKNICVLVLTLFVGNMLGISWAIIVVLATVAGLYQCDVVKFDERHRIHKCLFARKNIRALRSRVNDLILKITRYGLTEKRKRMHENLHKNYEHLKQSLPRFY